MKKVLTVTKNNNKYKVSVELIKSYTDYTSKFRVRVFHKVFKIRAPHENTAINRAIEMFSPYEQELSLKNKVNKSEAKFKEGIDLRTKRKIFKYVLYCIIFVLLFIFNKTILGKAFVRILPFFIILIIVDFIVALIKRRKRNINP